jgi:hypothetical protein
MQRLTKSRTHTKSLLLALLAATMMLSACGGGSSGGSAPIATLSGNWQFTLAPPSDGSFLGGPQGGFLLQTGGSVTGTAAYAVSLPNLLIPCNSGSAAITGMVSGQNVTLTAVAGTQTFTFAGALSFDGSTMAGTYISTPGTAGDGAPCGTAQTGLQWSAILVPPIAGTIQGNFHSTGGLAGLTNQVFPMSGSITQAANTGASSAIVTGTLNAIDYSCFATASIYGQISGNSLTLQIVGPNQSVIGQIGEPAGSFGITGINPVTFDSASGGYVVHGVAPSYLVATTSCPGSLSSITTAGDYGDICLSVGSPSGTTSACPQEVSLSPSSLSFLPQLLGSSSVPQIITLANTSGANIIGLTIALLTIDGVNNFTDTDSCGLQGAPSQGQPFNLGAGQSCVITVTFVPQELCLVGTPPAQCPSALTEMLTVTSPNNNVFSASLTGTVLVTDAASTSEPGHTVQTSPASNDRIFQDVERYAETY